VELIDEQKIKMKNENKKKERKDYKKR